VTKLAKYAITMTGRDLVIRMPGGHGGPEILPEAVGTILARRKEGA
jgi:hypothetical protein